VQQAVVTAMPSTHGSKAMVPTTPEVPSDLEITEAVPQCRGRSPPRRTRRHL